VGAEGNQLKRSGDGGRKRRRDRWGSGGEYWRKWNRNQAENEGGLKNKVGQVWRGGRAARKSYAKLVSGGGEGGGGQARVGKGVPVKRENPKAREGRGQGK